MNRPVTVRAILLTGLLCAGTSIAQAPQPSPTAQKPSPSAADLRADLNKFDLNLDTMQRMTTLPPSLALLFPDPDFRNRRLSDDWRDYVLPSEDLATIATQRERISREIDQGQLESAAGHLHVLEAYARMEAQTAAHLVQYWQKVGSHPPNWQPYFEMLRANGLEPHFINNFESLERTFKLQVSKGRFEDAMTVTWPKLVDIHARGARLDSHALKALAKPANGLFAMPRAGECSPPAASTSGLPTVKLDQSFPGAPASYPDGSRHRSEEGNVLVGLVITPQGCVAMASVFGSTGYEALDRAAVTHALTLRFLPADNDGVAVEHVAILPVTYKLPGPK